MSHYHSCDPAAMAVAIDNTVALETNRKYCTVELSGTLTRGQMVVDWNGRLNKEPNVYIVTRVNLETVKRFYEEMLQ